MGLTITRAIPRYQLFQPFICTILLRSPVSSDGPPSQGTLMLLPIARWRSQGEHKTSVDGISSLVWLAQLIYVVSTDKLGSSSRRFIRRDPCIYLHNSAGPSRKSASIEGDAEVGLTGTEVDMELDASTGDMAEVGIDPMTAPLVEEEIVEPAGEDSPDSPGTGDGIVRSVEDTPVDLSDVVRDFYHHISEIRVDRIVGIETAQRRLEAD
ncbi:hypothetical protein Tco_0645593 [Tanacetum coccineum]